MCECILVECVTFVRDTLIMMFTWRLIAGLCHGVGHFRCFYVA